MFNFKTDSAAISQGDTVTVNASSADWTVFVDSKNWALVVAD
ncbi:hypothetical protein [Idiomarina sp. HP20-50]|nr:hypothetical protein [Idiomarina sp. HP20-50]MDV6316270.1 hypothetical protein [Idiomarina sp. HP20-50]